MFSKPNSSCTTAKANNPPPQQSNKNNKKGGKKNNKNTSNDSSSTTSASIDTPLRKSDIRNLKQSAKDFFASNNGTTTTDDQEQLLLASILDQVFVMGQVASRQLHHAELGRLTLYVRTPSNNTTDAWPYANAQVIWIKQPPMPHTNQVEVAMPTVALLSVLPPESMATVYIPSPASKYLCRGAHLMRAGMLNLPSSQQVVGESNATAKLRQAPLPRPVAVAIAGNPQPMAVGLVQEGVQSAADIGPGTKGIGAHVWTCYGDDLWQQQLNEFQTLSSVPSVMNSAGGASYNDGQYGNVGFVDGQAVLPIVKKEDLEQEQPRGETTAADATEKATIDTNRSEEKETKEEGETSAEPATADPSAESTSHEQNNEETSEQSAPDISQEDLLHQSVCKALLTSLSPKDLPMTVANFYANHVLPNRPEGTTIQLKQTRYKKFGNYLQEQVECKLLTLGPGPNKGNKDKTGYLVSFDKRHVELRDYKQDHAEEVQDAKDTAQAAAASKQLKLVLVNLYVVPHHFVALLRLDPDAVKAANASSADRAGTGMLTLPEVRNLLEDYLKREDLINFDEVQLDGPLFDALYKKKKQANDGAVTNDLLTVSRKDLADNWVAAMNPAYAIVQMPGNKVTKLAKGKPPKVQVEVSMRQSKKFVTKIRGMETYGVNGQLLAKDIGKRLACQATVETQSEKGAALPKGCVEIVLGGNFADEIEALLLGDEKLCPSHGGIKNSEYKLPKGCIDLVRKGVPARKKRGGGKKR
ncbi:Eukaryotic translation initiation factor 2D [Seminavis robusta]|uniref:Eukaryotic translation initiation factor 2D n=1 Tax=Seminavis robusta TaxID=568900 RepID=A0A9N8EAF5_9STRA|nr:Eukaryotic translation initiation factor 2D [Seminavis robusta]|eukprot:Sro686_g187160.1 Eukaryotic translation initiation factor 2D (754) ;mRNA; r:47552-49898